MSHRPNPHRIKIHFSYTVDEISERLGVHPNTVRSWLRRGLSKIDDERPTLVYGQDLFDFLDDLRRRAKQACPLGYLYCVKCRAPRWPAGEMVDYVALSPKSGNLRGICPVCDRLMHRRISLAKVDQLRALLDVAILEGERRINESQQPSVSCEFGDGDQTHGQA